MERQIRQEFFNKRFSKYGVVWGYIERLLYESLLSLDSCLRRNDAGGNAYLEKYRLQKRGLMQKLLTGEWQITTRHSCEGRNPKQVCNAK